MTIFLMICSNQDFVFDHDVAADNNGLVEMVKRNLSGCRGLVELVSQF